NEAKDHHAKKDRERSARQTSLSDAEAHLKAIDATIEQHRRELAELGVADTSDDAWAQARRELERWQREAARLDDEHRALERDLAVAKDGVKRVGEQIETRRQELEEADRSWRPQQERWERLHKDALEQGLLGQALADRYVSRYEGRGSANIANEAKSQARLVIERLSRTSDGAEPAALLRNILDAAALGERCIEAWAHVRSWIQRRLPSQTADEPDPRVALGRLREQLGRLQEKLERQERELRGDSENVARNIDNQKRRARRQIHLLNSDLDHVRFGSINGVQIAVSLVDQMERVLEALRTGEAKDLLFKPDMPIEQAIDEL